MNKPEHLSEFEIKLTATYGLTAIQKGLPYKLSHLTNFPYSSLNDLRTAYIRKEINLGGNYNHRTMEFIGTKMELYLHFCIANIPFVIIIADIVLSIIYQNWILLIGVPLSVLGFLSSSEYNPMKNSLYGLSGFLFIISFFVFSWS